LAEAWQLLRSTSGADGESRVCAVETQEANGVLGDQLLALEEQVEVLEATGEALRATLAAAQTAAGVAAAAATHELATTREEAAAAAAAAAEAAAAELAGAAAAAATAAVRTTPRDRPPRFAVARADTVHA